MALASHAAWLLIAAVVVSLAYEVFRATARKGVSKYDSGRSVMIGLPLYAGMLVVAALLFTGELLVVWVALLITLAFIAVSIFYYGPVMLMARQPRVIDHLEDRVYTGLLFVAAALLIYRILGLTLS